MEATDDASEAIRAVEAEAAREEGRRGAEGVGACRRGRDVDRAVDADRAGGDETATPSTRVGEIDGSSSTAGGDAEVTGRGSGEGSGFGKRENIPCVFSMADIESGEAVESSFLIFSSIISTSLPFPLSQFFSSSSDSRATELLNALC